MNTQCSNTRDYYQMMRSLYREGKISGVTYCFNWLEKKLGFERALELAESAEKATQHARSLRWKGGLPSLKFYEESVAKKRHKLWYLINRNNEIRKQDEAPVVGADSSLGGAA